MEYSFDGEKMNCYIIGETKIEIKSEIPLIDNSFLNRFSMKEEKAGKISENVCKNLEKEMKNKKITYELVSKQWEPKEGVRFIWEKSDQRVYYDGAKYYRQFLKGYPEQKTYACAVTEDGNSNKVTIYIPPDSIDELLQTKFLLNVMIPETAFISVRKCILHASHIQWKGKSILFTAPCETGKSTQAELWRSNKKAVIVNGDRALIYKNKDGIYEAAGLPFCGSSDICKNNSSSIGLIVILEQSNKNEVKAVSKKEIFCRLTEQVTMNRWMPVNYKLWIDLICDLIQCVPVVKLCCRPDEEAVLCLEKYMLENIYK